MITPTRKDAYKLMLDGVITLSQVEANGIRVDEEKLDKNIRQVSEQIEALTKKLRDHPTYRIWHKRFGSSTRIGSREQIGEVLFEVLKYPCKYVTATGRPSTTDIVLRAVPDDFPKIFLELEKLKKFRATTLFGIKEELVSGYLHPVFNLHIVQTYRSSSDSINFQNIPVRDPVLGKMVRDCFIPRPGCHLVETDYGALEFRIAACFWKDPGMVEYASDPSKDIHRDTAAKCYLCPKDMVSKKMRYNGKNCFVFPVLYGSYWRNCAKNLWPKGGEKLKDDTTDLLAWLKKKGIKEIGSCGKGELPREGTFEHHIYKVEKNFNQQFPLFGQGKERWWDIYQKRGWFDLMTGFRVSGVYSRNDLMNYPIQGPGFHALLWSLNTLQRLIKKRKLRTLLVGQIHDCILADVPEEELQEYLSLVKEVMTVRVRKAMPWIIVPLEMEPEVTPLEGTWHQKALWVYKNGQWCSKN